jgi:hypothetical protein
MKAITRLVAAAAVAAAWCAAVQAQPLQTCYQSKWGANDQIGALNNISAEMSRTAQISSVVAIESSPPGSRIVCFFGTHKSGLQFLLEPVGVAADVERHGVMQ